MDGISAKSRSTPSSHCSAATRPIAPIFVKERPASCGAARIFERSVALAERESSTLDEKILGTETALKMSKGAILYEVPDDARYAGTPRAWGA